MHGYDLELMAQAQQAAQQQSLAEIHRRQALQGMTNSHSPFPAHCHGMLAGAEWSPQEQGTLINRTAASDGWTKVCAPSKPATFREELQQEIDEWLKV